MTTLSVDEALRLADQLEQQGQAAQASQVVAQVADALRGSDPTAAGLTLLASLEIRQGRMQAAVEAYERALQAAPSARDDARTFAQVLGEVGYASLAQRLVRAIRQASDRDYQSQVLERRSSPYLDYPHHVHLETLARCNAACNFCPYDGLERKGARLDDAVIEKVIQDLTDVPRDLPFQISPFKVNEPFLDVRLFDVLALIEDRLPQVRITLTSNASALTDKQARRLAGVRSLQRLWISFNDHRKEDYEATMKLPYDRTIARLDHLHDLLTGGDLAIPITLSRVGDGSEHDLAFRTWVARRWPRFSSLVMQRGNWLGQVSTDVPDVPDVGCLRWFELSITATGQVAHCCMDGSAAWPIGDVRSQHVLEIYNQPDYRALRERTLSRRDAHPCSTCTFM